MKKQKERLFRIEEILFKYSDNDHSLNAFEIMRRLKSDYDIDAERKSIYDDLGVMMNDVEFGIVHNDKPNGYAWIERTFELQELKLMIDAIQSSKFLSDKETENLVKKIKTLCSVEEGKQLQRQLVVANRVKNMNKSVFFSVSAIHEAIAADRQISFKYFNYDVNKQKSYRFKGKLYIRSPFMMLYSDDCYYLLAYDPEKEELRTYRVDRMDDVKVEDSLPREGHEAYATVDSKTYTQYSFSMYGGEVKKVSITFANSLMNAVIDKFGRDVWAVKVDRSHFSASVSVAVSPQFFGWLFGLGEKAVITAPDEIRQEFINYVDAIRMKYQ